jgi:DNA-binding NarL/FixJ family response regulator
MKAENDKAIRIIIVDQNDADAERALAFLRDAGMIIEGETAQSEEGLARSVREFKPDVVLSEYALPLLDYRTAIAIAQSIRPGIPVIVYSGPLREEDSGSCIRAGAESFISKLNLSPLPAAVFHALEAREPLLRLTSRQIQVMRLVASGYRTSEVAQVLKLSAKTVESHRHQLMRKLGIARTASLIRYAVRVGFAPVNAPVSAPVSLME